MEPLTVASRLIFSLHSAADNFPKHLFHRQPPEIFYYQLLWVHVSFWGSLETTFYSKFRGFLLAPILLPFLAQWRRLLPDWALNCPTGSACPSAFVPLFTFFSSQEVFHLLSIFYNFNKLFFFFYFIFLLNQLCDDYRWWQLYILGITKLCTIRDAALQESRQKWTEQTSGKINLHYFARVSLCAHRSMNATWNLLMAITLQLPIYVTITLTPNIWPVMYR